MNPMMAAIQKRKSGESLMGDHSASHMSEHADVGAGKDLHGMVASLSPHEKEALRGILDKDKGAGGMDISKGLPSKEEHAKIAQASAKEDNQNMLEESQETPSAEMSEDQSDDIAKSMLDSRHMRGMATEKPRNLGERMKQHLASKLKAKGKI